MCKIAEETGVSAAPNPMMQGTTLEEYWVLFARSVSNCSSIWELHFALFEPYLNCVMRFWFLYNRMNMDSLQFTQRRMAKIKSG